ncbi:MAG: hypothetical protein A2W23_02405 [Planctomycetes bacterium RBG_16_43_13]|nr:MAG: hypothetical protein A2W23_02405 [Planctomycetes bacterium RBG_16_43_13]
MTINIGSALFAILQGLKGTLMADNSPFPNTKLRVQCIDRVCNCLLDGNAVAAQDLTDIMGFCSSIRRRTKTGYEKTAIDVIDCYLSAIEKEQQ